MSDQGGGIDRPIDFDVQAAWLRRFSSDAESNLRALALRLREAMPERVTVKESKGFFSRVARITGVTVEMDGHNYALDIVDGRLKASIAMVVRGIAISTKPVDPGEWFLRLSDETRTASDHAKRLSRSISDFMST